jgi:Tol biopolymer transport system component
VALTLGARLGPYEIIAQIGVGGMGEVYRATDTNLGRDVALKVLPETFAQDPERLARFEREAKTLASLNHSNIAIIHGFEKAPGLRGLVMELVEGPTLADRLAQGAERSGHALPIDETLAIAKQIAEALEAAHEQNIIHRDLKPSNIKLRPDGTVKVLDFGLAKAMEPTGMMASGPSQSPTITTPAMTQAGVILGTAAYMSPEQARGKVVDKRADIWAFGCVLYEMLTGRRVFEGDEVSDTLAAVLTKDPDWGALPADTPTAVRRLLRRCLARDRRARLPDIGSARLDIDEARAEPFLPTVDPGPVESNGARARRFVTWAAGTAAVAALAAFGVWTAMPAQPAGLPIARVLIGVGPAERLLSGLPLDTSSGQGRPSRTAIAFSPDGRSLVFSAEGEGRVQLYLRRLDQLEATAISGTEGASNPFFSPDGRLLGFHADGALKKVPLHGGPVVELCKVDLVYGVSWGRSNQIVFAQQNGGLWRVSAAGGTPTAVTKLDGDSGEVSHRLPQFLPDGDTVLSTVTRSGFPSWDDTLVVAQSLATGERRVLIEGGADARFVPTGHLVFLRRGTLMAVPFDARRLQVSGAPVGLIADVMQAANIQPLQIDTGAGQFAVSDSGSLVYATGGVYAQDRWSLVWVDRTGRSEALRVAPGSYLAPRLSPDGRRVAFNSSTGDWDIWTYDVQRGIAARVPMEGEQSGVLWTPDGSRLIFSSAVKGRRALFSIDPDGSGSAEPLTATDLFEGVLAGPNAWSSDGTSLVVVYNRDIWVLSRDGKAERRRLVTTPGAISAQADFSPDDRWLAYSTFPVRQVYVQPYPALDRRVQVSTDNGSAPAWRQDGRELYYAEDASAGGPLRIRVMAVPITTTPTFSAGTPRVLFEGPFRIDGPFRGYDVTPDGQRFLMVREVPQQRARVSQMVLVQNWLEELKRLVPTN